MSVDPCSVLTLPEAAARLQVSVKTIRRYIAEGRLEGFRVGPTLLRVQAPSVDRLLEQLPTAQRACPRSLLGADHIRARNVLALSAEEHSALALP